MSSRDTSSYRAYVAAMKTKINEADLLEARATITRRRRRKTAASTGKAIMAGGSVAAVGVVIGALVRFTSSEKKKS